MSDAHVLPDSRLTHRPDLGSEVVDWPLPGGGTVRCEAVRIYCANCGKLYGFVPRDNTTFAFWLCQPCFDKFGHLAGTYAAPDDEFRRAVAEEMRTRFGRDVTDLELLRALESGDLGTALTKLIADAPHGR